VTVFHASVQYGDWEGGSAADGADKNDIGDLMRQRGLLRDGEFIVGVRAFFGENHGGKVRGPHVEALVVSGGDYDSVKTMLAATPDPLPLRKVEVDMTPEEFFGLFKRFDLTISRRGLDLLGREY
jgi:hypothetical protein